MSLARLRIGLRTFALFTAFAAMIRSATAERPAEVSAADFPSIQAAIDAAPGGTIRLPPGDWEISEPLFIRADGTELSGRGRIIQTNPGRAILRIEGAKRIRVEGLAFTRAPGREETRESGIRAERCADLEIVGVRVTDNWTEEAAIRLNECRDAAIRDCAVVNYKRIAVDDRTASDLYGYAFLCVNGTGIMAERVRGLDVTGCRVTEERLRPTRELMERHRLGELTDGARPSKPGPLGQEAAKLGRVRNWHQGSAILVTSPEESSLVRVEGNRIENCAQGIDLHCDRVLCSGNQIEGAMIGVKAMHGSRGLIVSNNLISRVDLWAIMLGPGSATRPAEKDRSENADGGAVVSGNVILDYGRGDEWWNWGGTSPDRGGAHVIRIDRGQLAGNSPFRGVAVTGNVVQDSEPFHALAGEPVPPPRYRDALFIEPNPASPDGRGPAALGVVVSGNRFDPGVKGEGNWRVAAEGQPAGESGSR